MKSIKSKKDLPYPIELIKDVAKIRFGKEYDGESELSLNEMIIMCNLIEGMIRVDDHYILMEDSLKIFQRIIKHGIYTNSYTYTEFAERKKNRAYKHKVGLIDTPLGTMETYYCNENMYNILNYKKYEK